jgi:hypothetical protein
MECYDVGDSLMATESGRGQEDQRPKIIAKTGRHKAQRVILTDNAEAIKERKLG